MLYWNLLNKGRYPRVLFIFTIGLLVTACADDSATTPGPTPAPDNAVNINTSNAIALTTLADQLIDAVVGPGTSLSDFTSTQPCPGSGDITPTDNLLGGSTVDNFDVSIAYNNCDDNNGITLNGTLSAARVTNISSQTYTENASGSFTGTASSGSFALNNYAYNRTGNNINSTYSFNTLSYEYAPATGGFGFSLQQPLAGDSDFSCPDNPASGILILTGANGTLAKATIGNQMIRIEAKSGAAYENALGSPKPCDFLFP